MSSDAVRRKMPRLDCKVDDYTVSLLIVLMPRGMIYVGYPEIASKV